MDELKHFRKFYYDFKRQVWQMVCQFCQNYSFKIWYLLKQELKSIL